MLKKISSGPALLFILIPYFLILLIGFLGYSVYTRDLDEYITQIEAFQPGLVGIDFISWSFLDLVLGNIYLDQNILRLFTFLLYASTCFLIYLFSKDKKSLYLFIISTGFLLPVLLLSQVRLLIAVCFFAITISIFKSRYFSIFTAALCHFSFFLLLFFPSIFFIGVIIEFISLLPLEIPGLLRIQSYFEIAKAIESGKSPIYFGWELIILASIYTYSKLYRVSFYIFLSLLGILYLHHFSGLSTDAARRLIELCIFAYSPFIIFALPHMSDGGIIKPLPSFLATFMWGLLLLQNYKLVELVLIY